jgi:AraC family transcriptional regulator
LAKIAVELDRALAQRRADGTPGGLTIRPLAEGPGWTADDVICTSGPDDRSFEERHTRFRIVLVVAGTFQCRSTTGRALLSPGSLFLGNDGQCFECGHDHGSGDRCVSLSYAPDYFERIVADAGVRNARPDFRTLRVPPLRALAPLIAHACTDLIPRERSTTPVSWEELSLEVAARTIQLAHGLSSSSTNAPSNTVSRVTHVVRTIDRHPDAMLTLGRMADSVGLSPYHFLRAFVGVTGVTPHQYVLRARLREAALRLVAEPAKILDVALDCGFGDVSNFNRAFRTEFGVSPRAYRQTHRIAVP